MGVVAIMMIQASNVITMPLLLARVNPTAAVVAHLLQTLVVDTVLDMTVDAPMAQTTAGDLVDLPLRAAMIATGALLPPVVALRPPLAETVMDRHMVVVEVLLTTVTVVTALMLHLLVVLTVVHPILTVDTVAVVVDLLPNHPATGISPLPVVATTRIMDLR